MQSHLPAPLRLLVRPRPWRLRELAEDRAQLDELAALYAVLHRLDSPALADALARRR